MSGILGKAADGLPALLGAVLGVFVFAGGCYWVFGTLLVIALAALCCAIGCRQLPSEPTAGRWLIEVWIVTAIGVVALVTALLIWIGLKAPPTWIGSLAHLSAEEAKAAMGVFVGAVSAYLALVWTKDIDDAKGFFWTSTRFKAGLGAAAKSLATPPQAGTRIFEVMYSDFVHSDAGEVRIDGWGFKARGQRLAEFIAAPKRPSP